MKPIALLLACLMLGAPAFAEETPEYFEIPYTFFVRTEDYSILYRADMLAFTPERSEPGLDVFIVDAEAYGMSPFEAEILVYRANEADYAVEEAELDARADLEAEGYSDIESLGDTVRAMFPDAYARGIIGQRIAEPRTLDGDDIGEAAALQTFVDVVECYCLETELGMYFLVTRYPNEYSNGMGVALRHVLETFRQPPKRPDA
ncbi:hypothetical protein LJC74_08965 [Eubacteriales bacterium OttesenSCG-928-A19]|nr:hypothetical protein [Eubacteriales bacterium OttesenSCG-928-A19]